MDLDRELYRIHLERRLDFWRTLAHNARAREVVRLAERRMLATAALAKKEGFR